eukprot:TRINITY_DN3427_c0_g2_i2.p1 TRINITY_DN3427_c0_g2~~TRINITY_DN3427_c0_g2_i2.p1  ORF type:complete len:203 (+),score=43.27 TRINITY_DN3427_c0_g2_i2:330-938(+)
MGQKLTMENAVAVVAELRHKHCRPNERVLIFATSLGGYIALAFAKKYPEFVAGLALCGTSNNFEGHRSRLLSGMNILFNKLLPGSTVASLISKAFNEVPRPIMEECVLRSGTFYEGWDDVVDVMCAEDTVMLVQALVHTPLLFVNGEKDIRRNERELVSASERAALVVVKRASHFVQLDSADIVNGHIHQFMVSIGFCELPS